MIVKDVLITGYPFVEAIASALPICDEFLISDGYSTDGTYEILKKISELNNKVKISRYEWPKSKDIQILTHVTNALRKKCKYDYIFYVQANEVVHEDNIRFIKVLPEMKPTVNTFSFPYLQLMRNEKYSQEFRLRFSKNLPEIEAYGDAWTLGMSRTGLYSKAINCLKNPKRFFYYFGNGIFHVYANTGTMDLSQSVYLPKPIFRYWSLFPRNHIEKCKKHRDMFNIKGFNNSISRLEKRVDEDPDSFLKDAAQIARYSAYLNNTGFGYPADLNSITVDEHPKIIQGLILDKSIKVYQVREEVLDQIKGL